MHAIVTNRPRNDVAKEAGGMAMSVVHRCVEASASLDHALRHVTSPVDTMSRQHSVNSIEAASR